MKTTKKTPKSTSESVSQNETHTPLTLKAALTKIVEHAAHHRYVQNVYSLDGDVCPVGLFFTKEQLDHVTMLVNGDGESMNGDNVLSLAQVLGADNIQAVTGMTPEQAYMIQYLNDIEGSTVMLAFVREILSGKRDSIGDVSFKIKAGRKK